MSLETREPVVEEEAGLALVLPPHLTENFELAEAKIKELYGLSPGVPALVRLWIACGTSWRVRREFESAVLEISRKTINPPEDGIFDEECL